MDELNFRKLLSKAGNNQASAKEYKLLDELVKRKIKKHHLLTNFVTEKSKRKVYQAIIKNEPTQKVFKLSRLIPYAAAIALIVIVGTLLRSNFDQSLLQTSTTYIEITTKAGERQTILLPDSSIVVINSNSSISYPKRFAENKRNVELIGEGFFKVQRNPEKPFIVKTNNVLTTVLGTSFNIKEWSNNVTVTVATGKVKVTKEMGIGKEILLPNQQVTYNSKTNNFLRSETNAERYIAWSKGILQFDQISVEKAIDQLEAWYNVNIECESEAMLKRTIQGKYQNKSIDYVLEDMEFILNLKYTYVNDSTIIFNN